MPRIRRAPTRAMGQGNRRTAPRARLLSKRRRRLRCALPPPPARPRRSSRHLRPRWLTATSAFHQTLQRTVARCGGSRPSLVPQQGCWRQRSHRLGQHSGEREPVCSQAFLRRCRRPSLRRCRRPRHRRCRRSSRRRCRRPSLLDGTARREDRAIAQRVMAWAVAPGGQTSATMTRTG